MLNGVSQKLANLENVLRLHVRPVERRRSNVTLEIQNVCCARNMGGSASLPLRKLFIIIFVLQYLLRFLR